MERIDVSSRRNEVIVSTAKLSDKKYRDVSGLFLLDGGKLVGEAVDVGLEIEYLICTPPAAAKYARLIESTRASRMYVATDEVFSRVTDEKSPEGIIAVVRQSGRISRDIDDINKLYGVDDIDDIDGIDSVGGAGRVKCRLMLDAVQNPDNLGAILRSANAFGQRGIILGAGCADIYGRRVMRASMGAALRARTYRARDVASVCRRLASHGRRVIAATVDAGAQSVLDFEFADGDVVVIGNEGHGISESVARSSTHSVYIPMEPGQESLNASCAATVILWELYRRRR